MCVLVHVGRFLIADGRVPCCTQEDMSPKYQTETFWVAYQLEVFLYTRAASLSCKRILVAYGHYMCYPSSLWNPHLFLLLSMVRSKHTNMMKDKTHRILWQTQEVSQEAVTFLLRNIPVCIYRHNMYCYKRKSKCYVPSTKQHNWEMPKYFQEPVSGNTKKVKQEDLIFFYKCWNAMSVTAIL